MRPVRRCFNASLVRLDAAPGREYQQFPRRFNASLVRLDDETQKPEIGPDLPGFNASLVRLDDRRQPARCARCGVVSMPVWFD